MSLTESCQKVSGVLKIIDRFGNLITRLLGDQLFGSVEILSRTLQGTSLSAAGTRDAANVDVVHFHRIRSDEETFEALWMRAEPYIDIEGTKLSRFSRSPVKLYEGAESHNFSPAINLYRQIYYQVLDTTAE